MSAIDDNAIAGVSANPVAATSLKRAFTRAFAGNMFYTACQGAMTIALARLGPPELLGTFGMGIAVAAPPNGHEFLASTLRGRWNTRTG